MGTILSDIKPGLGIDPQNLGFDTELLLFANAVFSGLDQVGVTLPDGFVVEAETDWPVLPNETITALVKPFVMMKVKSIFDPIPSETIAKVFGEKVTEFEGRIAHEIDEVENNV